MWMINSVTVVSINCNLMIIHSHLHLCLPYIVREVSGWARIKPLQAGITLLHIKHYGIEITIQSYCLSWEIELCEMRFGRCVQPIH